jgi:hypothetical protein
MLPGLRLIVAGFLCGFVVVFAGLRLATSLSGIHQALPIVAAQAAAVPSSHGHGPWVAMPALHDMRLAGDMRGIAGPPAPLPANAPPPQATEHPIEAPMFRLEALIVGQGEPDAAAAPVEPASTTAADLTGTAEPRPASDGAETTTAAAIEPPATATDSPTVAALAPTPLPSPPSASGEPVVPSDAAASFQQVPDEAAMAAAAPGPETIAADATPSPTSATGPTAADTNAPRLAGEAPMANAMAMPPPVAKPETQPAKLQRKKRKRAARRAAANNATGNPRWNWSGGLSSHSFGSSASQ